jgi:hypothetical protein
VSECSFVPQHSLAGLLENADCHVAQSSSSQ